MPDLVPVGTVTPEEKAKVVEVLTTSEAKAAIMDAIRPNSIDVTELETAGTLNGKSLPILDNSENKLKSYPFTSLQNVMGDMVAATTSANEAASAANAAKLDCDAAAAEASQAAQDAASDTAEAINTMSATVANAIEEMEDVVGNLDLSSVGGTEDLRDILVANNYGYSVIQDIGHSTSTNKATIVRQNTAFSAIYKVNEGSKIYGAVVTMGGNDITSSAVILRTRERCSVAISSVTGNVEILIIATKPIVFEDEAVKAICVENWGGQFIEGEITEYEASKVTNLGIDKDGNLINSGAGPFYANANISYFNEFRYFTGIVGRGLHWQNTGSTAATYRGVFAACSLKKITIPAIQTTNLSGAFYYCNKLEEIDLSNLILAPVSTSDRRIAVAFTGCTAVKKVIFPSASIILDSTYQAFGGANSSACSNLEYIDFKNMDFRNYPTTSNTPNPMLRYCPKLAHLPSGMRNLAHSHSFAYNPLTHDSAVNLLMTLKTATGLTITFSAATYATLTEDEIAIGTDKGWTVTSA